MPLTVEGTTYYHYPRAVVVDEDGNPVENRSGGFVTLPGSDDPLPVLAYDSYLPLTELVTSNRGLLPDVWIACGTDPVDVRLDWADDDIPPQAWSPTSSEVAQFLRANTSTLVTSINTQTGASYTLTLDDATRDVDMSSASPQTLTVPADATAAIPVGSRIGVTQMGVGPVTVEPVDGAVSVLAIGDRRTLAGRYARATLVKRAADVWQLTGALGVGYPSIYGFVG